LFSPAGNCLLRCNLEAALAQIQQVNHAGLALNGCQGDGQRSGEQGVAVGFFAGNRHHFIEYLQFLFLLLKVLFQLFHQQNAVQGVAARFDEGADDLLIFIQDFMLIARSQEKHADDRLAGVQGATTSDLTPCPWM